MSDNIKEVNSKNFKEEVLDAKEPVMVDFFADWCPPCKVMNPIIDRIAEENIGKYKVVKLDIDESSDIAAQFKVRSIPAFFVFKDGVVYKNQVGRTSLENLLKLFE